MNNADFNKTSGGVRIAHGKFESQVCLNELKEWCSTVLHPKGETIPPEVEVALIDFYNYEYGLYEDEIFEYHETL